MIKVYISNASDTFVKKVNSKITEFLIYYITVQEDHDDYRYEGAFPNYLFRTNKTRCEEVISELYEYSIDNYQHVLSPLHEYALFQIINYCEDSFRDYELEKKDGEGSLFDILDRTQTEKEEYPPENGGYTLSNFHTFDFYYENLFEDFDFLDVDFYYNKFRMSPKYFIKNVNVNLDNYLELMPPDIRTEYLHIKQTNNFVDSYLTEGEENKVFIQDLIDELTNISPGKKDAKRYESLMARILTLLFSPFLTDPHTQVRTFDEREIIDMTFYNSAANGFWHDIKVKHRSNIIVLEFKNKELLGNEDNFQISTRLNDEIGRFGILLARKINNLDKQRAYRRLNRGNNVILLLTDEDIIKMLEEKVDATSYIASKYREFMEES